MIPRYGLERKIDWPVITLWFVGIVLVLPMLIIEIVAVWAMLLDLAT